jgi:hypothetical protein
MGCLTKLNHGTLDPLAVNATHVGVHGWAWSEQARKGGWAPVAVEVALDGAAAVTVPAANVTRADLVDAGVAPNAQHGFVLAVAIPTTTAAAAAAAAATATTRAAATGNHDNTNERDYDSDGVAATHVVHVSGVAPDGTRFELDSSPRCFQGVMECPCPP